MPCSITGSVMYCHYHDQGCLVINGDKRVVRYEMLSRCICRVDICSFDWQQHGTFRKDEDNIFLDLEGKDDDLGGG